MCLFRGRHGRLKRLWLFMAAVLIGMLLFFDFNLKPIILSMASAQARVMATNALNTAVYELMREKITYQDLVTVITDNEGRVAMLQADTMRMTELGARAALLAQRNLNELSAADLRIPIGAITGVRLLAGRGPGVHVNIIPMGSATVEFIDDFSTAGINQTRHRIYLRINATVRMVIPTASSVSDASTQVLLSESILIGQVPGTYANVAPDNILDLAP
ncbi:MAG: sporulation protein YunB [Oscillospiraceae bacterium]|nr:sporulation protein YunB [Oscillospiraceae bacterium]